MNSKQAIPSALCALVLPGALGLALSVTSCTSSTTGSAPGAGDSGAASFAGTYSATFTGTYQNTSPNTASGTVSDTATIVVTNVSASEVELAWQVQGNPPSGTAEFLMSGDNGTLVDAGAPVASGAGAIVGGSCFVGTVNGNSQKNCCTSCTVSFDGTTMTQPNAGIYAGVNAQGIAYTGTYAGTWTATRQ